MPDSPTSALVVQAAQNNAWWCDTVCRAHGLPSAFHDHLWINRHPVPRFYPNVVTLAAQDGAAAQLAAIQALVADPPQASFAVKDSFATLDLSPLGFHVLFDATWLWRPAALPSPVLRDTGLRWTTIHEPDDLRLWEMSWNGPPVDPAASYPPSIFLPALLADPAVRFIAGYQDQQIVAGAIANRSGDVVGVSNVFAPAETAEDAWAGCLATMIDHFPGVPLVGYEQGQEQVIAQALGFDAIGPLRVWGR